MGDVEEAEAEAVVLKDKEAMMTVAVVVVPAEEVAMEVVVTLITATVTEAGDREVEVLDVDQDAAGVPEVRETEVQLGKGVPKEGRRLSNGTEKKNRRKQFLKPLLVKIIMIALMKMVLYRMETENDLVIHISQSRNKRMTVVMITDESRIFWFVLFLIVGYTCVC